MDFTLSQYQDLLLALQSERPFFQRVSDFLDSPLPLVYVLRHDVDDLPENSLRFAQIQHRLAIKGTYYFRIVKKSFNTPIIKEIADLGHEIGYHYETMSSNRGNIDKAWDEFRWNLETFRKIVPVSTICMHGSPLSGFDNKLIWQKYDYHDLGITGEPYIDIDFTKTGYLSDTGRRWNGSEVSVRDKVSGSIDLNFRSTVEIIQNVHQLPDKVLFTFHPQRWHDGLGPWLVELVAQKLKNTVKYIIVKSAGNRG